MGKLSRTRPSPAMAVAVTALFLAVGGSAFALGQKTTPQVRCATGAIKGIAYVTGDPRQGLANLPSSFSNAPELFGARFNCSGGTIEVKKDETTSGDPAIDVRFVGNSGTTAIGTPVSGTDPGGLAVSRLSDGSFRVILGGPSIGSGQFGIRNNLPFVLVLI
jgi:hypothetical protein